LESSAGALVGKDKIVGSHVINISCRMQFGAAVVPVTVGQKRFPGKNPAFANSRRRSVRKPWSGLQACRHGRSNAVAKGPRLTKFNRGRNIEFSWEFSVKRRFK